MRPNWGDDEEEISWGWNLIRCFNHEVDLKKPETPIGKKIHPGEIYVGGIDSTYPENLRTMKYTHIIHLETPIKEIGEEFKHIKQLSFKIYDMENTNLIVLLPRCFNFLDEAFRENRNAKVLIHCLAGISRSSSVFIAYLMSKKKIGFRKAIDLVKVDRKFIEPNSGFLDQLNMFQWNGFRLDEKLMEMSKVLLDDNYEFGVGYSSLDLKEEDFRKVEKIAVELIQKRKENLDESNLTGEKRKRKEEEDDDNNDNNENDLFSMEEMNIYVPNKKRKLD